MISTTLRRHRQSTVALAMVLCLAPSIRRAEAGARYLPDPTSTPGALTPMVT